MVAIPKSMYMTPKGDKYFHYIIFACIVIAFLVEIYVMYSATDIGVGASTGFSMFLTFAAGVLLAMHIWWPRTAARVGNAAANATKS